MSTDTNTISTTKVAVSAAFTDVYLLNLEKQKYKDAVKPKVSWLFEEEQTRITDFQPDIVVYLGTLDHDDGYVDIGRGTATRTLVASPKFTLGKLVSSPRHLETFRYASLNDQDMGEFRLRATSGDTLTIFPKNCMKTNSLFAARMAAQLGIAFALIPVWLAWDDLQNGTLISLLPKWKTEKLPVSVLIKKSCIGNKTCSSLGTELIDKLSEIQGLKMRQVGTYLD